MSEEETKQKVINRLKGKTSHDYHTEYCEAEQKLRDSLKELSNFGKDCDCEECEECKIIHEGNFDEINIYCLDCGGYISY